ncbi:ribonuclease H [Rhizobium leguminosarum]|uniref:ribonuclease H family protein n=1 Tax=Rhizobium leguminosarum TaxID=384 RepID=UPI001C942E83|nr:ribonuclease H [Rhizobium leguminosarum]MBY5624456.1 ribonuclease HI [Rhizobium leguminosarum]
MNIRSEIEIFSDGAAEPNPGAGGWAFVVYEKGVEIHHSVGCETVSTNNRMEMSGVLQGLRWATINAAGKSVSVFSDSQYVVKGCNEWRHNWKRKGWKRGQKEVANVDLWLEMDAALTVFPVELRWIKGHSGIAGNERADELAFAAATMTETDGDYLTAEYRRVMDRD